MSDIYITKEVFLQADWITIFEKFAGKTDRISKFLRQVRGKYRIYGRDCDEFLRTCGSKVNKSVVFKVNNTAEFN